MKYKATARGVINITMAVNKPDGTVVKEVHPRVIEPGEVFDYIGNPGSMPPSWAVPFEVPRELVVEKESVVITGSEGTEDKKPEEGKADVGKAEPQRGRGNEKAPKP